MSKAWNLAPAEWSRVLLGGLEVQKMAESIKAAPTCSWATVLLDLARDSKTVLDLGSGRGQHAAALALEGKDLTLLDWSAENVTFSEQLFASLNKKGRFCQGDMLKPLPFEDNSFDTVFSCGVFEYFSDEEIVRVLEEAFRVAKKQVIIMVPNALSVSYRVGKFYQEKRGVWEWGGERPHATLKPFFRKAGCRAVEEMSVAAKTSLEFLTMPGGAWIRNAAIKLLRMTDHPKPSKFAQGYLLITIGQKA